MKSIRFPLKYRCLLIGLILPAVFILSCGEGKEENRGETLAKNYCSSCHLFPQPGLLDTLTWKRSVLPAMGKLLGIEYYNGQAFRESTSPLPSADDWNAIVDYYLRNAPPVIPPQQRKDVREITGIFQAHKASDRGNVPATGFLKIDSFNHLIYSANAFDSSLSIFDESLNFIRSKNMGGVVIDMDFQEAKDQKDRSGIFTNIGILFPNDLKKGSVSNFRIDENEMIDVSPPFIVGLPRPVQTLQADFNRDGLPDYLVCGFGNKTGALMWMKNLGAGKFQENIIRPLPGAIKAYIDDFNRDGLPDIIALFGQAEEGIYLFENKGDETFTTKPILKFPPVYGSSFFEMIDWNGDGKKDILYTCGDNADLSPVLKNYHGVYIFLNNGKDEYIQKFFFPIYGCYKALARDFDKDGDLDLATIAYFPDEKKSQESFIYLENTGDFNFKPFSIADASAGSWLTMDAGDVDGDGDEDIVIGNFQPPLNKRFSSKDAGEKYSFSFILLENKLR